MIATKELLDYLQQLLQPQLFKDYAPNGLQVAGKDTVSSIVCGVSACQALIDAAVAKRADAILVHHGFFWRGEDPCVVGIKRQRLASLLRHDINLIAYHLPLDAHPDFGNNIELSRRLGITMQTEFNAGESPALGRIGEFSEALSGAELASLIAKTLQRQPLHIPGASAEIKRVAWCTGAAQDFLLAASEHGIDAFITGEISERTTAIARETGVHFFAAGHHATERYGVQALGVHLQQQFALSCEFIDIDNPV